MDMKLNDYPPTSYADVSAAQTAAHNESFSSASSGPSSAHYDPFTPVSGRSTPSSSQRMSSVGSVDFDAAMKAASVGSFSGVPLDLTTPPPSATVPFFNLSMSSDSGHASAAAAAAAAVSVSMSGMVAGAPTTSGPDMTTGYFSSSSFPHTSSLPAQPPATPNRHNSFASQSAMPSPTSPTHMLSSSYPSSVSSMPSMTSMSSVGSSVSSQQHQHQHQHQQNMMCGPGNPDAYPFADMHHGKQQQQQNQYHYQQQQQHQHQTPHQQQHLQSYSLRPQHPSPPYGFPTPPPTQGLQNECGDISPSEFYWQHRTDSPPISTFFDERPTLPPPPPSATLRSSVVKREFLEDFSSPVENDGSEFRRFSTVSSSGGSPSYGSTATPTPPSRRRLFVDNAQLKSAALQRHLGVPHGSGGRRYGNDGSGGNTATNSAANNSDDGSDSPYLGGHIITRNGIQVSKVASGAFKCIVKNCPSRPFKRSEHLKRHVTTHHDNKDAFPCEFCGRVFNRKDNWRSHLKLHTVARGKNARTDYFPKAVRVFDEEMRKVSKCRPRKEKGYAM
ncbi:Zinc finger, C2H2-type/integrase, DNA-binding protein [Niveomyces insectorum RCEF 264]|uniref:Zinc finger, C2H2-type/integrase, DNA-binding protein n=1 Tax=Niveomyces insectorum RCEF 264 TaxID=1081102 RepID=A0A167QEF9_9HYPO|nr:Zinc finger, C2H2-type/integrase, DNA-binding protein [Niveomyces insectorum RCEF 264]